MSCIGCSHPETAHDRNDGGCIYCNCPAFLPPSSLPPTEELIPEAAWQLRRCCVPVENMADPVNHPAHYTTGKIEVIEFIDDQKLGFYEGNVVKYVARARHKGSELEDLKKARWYLTRKIDLLERGEC